MQQRQTIVVAGGVVLLAVVLAVTTGGLGAADASTAHTEEGDRSITVSTSGEAEAAPDKGVVRVRVSAENETIDSVRTELAADAAAVRDELDALGVEYRTNRFSLDETRDYPAYRGDHSFVVTVDDPERVGTVVDAAATAGAEIQSVELTLSDEKRAQLRDSAIEHAVDNARGQAEAIASQSGLAVTSVATVDAEQQSYEPSGVGLLSATNVDSTQVDSGPVSVAYQVTVTFDAVVD